MSTTSVVRNGVLSLRIGLCLALALAWLSVASPAVAQPGDGQDNSKADAKAKAAAGKFLAAGDKLLKQGDRWLKRKRAKRAIPKFERALEAYQRAFDIYPKPQLYWLIGLAEQRLGRHLDALNHFQQLLREATDIKDALRERVESNMEESKQHVVTLTFKVMPEGAAISINGDEIGNAPYDEPVFVDAGEYTVSVTAPGYSPFEDTVELEVGTESERTVKLEKVPVLVKKPRPRPVAVRKPTPRVSKRPLIIGVSVTAGLGALATVTGLVAVAKHGTFTDSSATPAARSSAADSGKTFALVTDLLWVGTIAAGAYTAYHYYKVYRPKKLRQEEKRPNKKKRETLDNLVWVAPYVTGAGSGASSLGVAAGGHF